MKPEKETLADKGAKFISRHAGKYFVGLFVLGFFAAFYGLDGIVELQYREGPMLSRSTQLAVQQYKIKVLENRINDITSGCYQRRVANLSGGVCSEVLNYGRVNDTLSGSLVATKRELEVEKKKLAKLSNKKIARVEHEPHLMYGLVAR